MGRKIIFELADIKRHCVSSTKIGSTFIGNIKEKIPVNAIKTTDSSNLTSEAQDKKSNKKRSAPSKRISKKKKRKVSISSESDATESETDTQECIDKKPAELSKGEGGTFDGKESGSSSSSGSESGSDDSEDESSGNDC